LPGFLPGFSLKNSSSKGFPDIADSLSGRDAHNFVLNRKEKMVYDHFDAPLTILNLQYHKPSKPSKPSKPLNSPAVLAGNIKNKTA
jgi:hypothetical protein